MRVLHVCAVEAEARGLPGGQERLVTGVGPASAAGRVARRLATGPSVELVIVSGVAGVLPVSPAAATKTGQVDVSALEFPLAIGDVVTVRHAAMVDEGVQTPAGFVGLSALGLPATAVGRSHDRLRSALVAAMHVPEVDCATASTGSGTDESAAQVALRLSAACGAHELVPGIETMESAAVALACADAGVPWIELRAISNRTGDRDRSGWALQTSLAALVERRALALQWLASVSGRLSLV